MESNKKLLVSGANGFIGSYFLSNYHQAYDVTPYSMSKNEGLSNLPQNIDVVIHLSAIVHQTTEISYDKYYQINVVNSIRLAKEAKSRGARLFVFLSSVKVFGEENEHGYKEDSPCNPVDSYGKTKLEAEKELIKLQDETFKIACIRSPLVYGPNSKANFKKLIWLVKTFPILPLDNINNKRSLIFIGNLCGFINHIIEKNISGTFIPTDSFPVSTTQLINFIKTGRTPILITLKPFRFFLKKIMPSVYTRLFGNLFFLNEKTMKDTGFKPQYPTEVAIKITLNSH